MALPLAAFTGLRHGGQNYQPSQSIGSSLPEVQIIHRRMAIFPYACPGFLCRLGRSKDATRVAPLNYTGFASAAGWGADVAGNVARVEQAAKRTCRCLVAADFSGDGRL